MRLALVMRVPLAEVLAWPDSHVQLLLAYLDKAPPVEERVELAIADLMALTFNVNRGESVPAKNCHDFLRFQDAWAPEVDPASALSPLERKLKNRLRHVSQS